MKKAFTLLEVIISITIFMIIIFFMYKVLNDTKTSGTKLDKIFSNSNTQNSLYKIISEDIIEATGTISTTVDRNDNSVLIFISNNSYNNPYFINIAYMISNEGNFLRVESKTQFKKEETTQEFYENSYVDILIKDVKKFNVINQDDKYIFIIKLKNNKLITFPTFIISEE